MKKRIFSFLLMLCLLIPCTFCFSGCDSKPSYVNLDGKTIIFDRVETLEQEAQSIYYPFVDPGTDISYIAQYSSEEFVEEFYNQGVISTITQNPNITTLEQAKEAFFDASVELVRPQFLIYKFAKDGSSVTTYAHNDTNLTTPLNTYSVRKSNTAKGVMYDFMEEGGTLIISEPGYIKWSGELEGEYFDVTQFTSIMMTCIAESNPSQTIERPLSMVERVGAGVPKGIHYKVL